MQRFVPELISRPPKPRAGRPQALGNSTLSNRRNRLLAIFETCWSEIGWALQTCKKPGDLVRIFSAPTGTTSQDVLAVFCIPSSLPGSRGNLRTVSRDLLANTGPRRDALEQYRKGLEQLQRAQRAVAHEKKGQLKLIRKEWVQCRLEAQRLEQLFRKLDEMEDHLLNQLKLAEASYSQHELFRFIRSKRYELTPLSLANAAAGMPELGWRQSMRLCARDRSVSGDGLHYQVFKAIRYLLSIADKKNEETLVEHVKNNIPLLPHRYRTSRNELADNWFFLHQSLRQSFRAKVHPKSLPFEVTRRYFNLSRVRSDTNILLAQRNRLAL